MDKTKAVIAYIINYFQCNDSLKNLKANYSALGKPLDACKLYSNLLHLKRA